VAREMMQVGIDSYCYHRFFGEVYAQQVPPPSTMSLEGFLNRAVELGVQGVSLESCFIPRLDTAYLKDVRVFLDDHHLDRVFAWGHPLGLEAGKSEQAYASMLAALPYAEAIGAQIMRVVSSNRVFRSEPHAPQLEQLTRLLRHAVKVAQDHGIQLAIENHIDYTAAELLQLLDAVDSPDLGINFDTGNFLRIQEDPPAAMEKLAGRVLATHIKDVRRIPGVDSDQWYSYAAVPVGEGVVDMRKLLQLLKAAHYTGMLAIEVDYLHPDWPDEDLVVQKSITALRGLVEQME
jgi:3-oxoisoapionate decarboxylase